MTHTRVESTSHRSDFPIFENTLRKTGRPLVYLDSAATTQKPRLVIDAVHNFLSEEYGTVHRGAYGLSIKASERYEDVRAQVARFVGGGVEPGQVIFTRGTTESLNVLANGLANSSLKEQDRIVVTAAEHHANLVPWQQAALRVNCEIGYIPLVGSEKCSDMVLDLERAQRLINARTKIVALAHVGNVLGQVNPVPEVVAMAGKVGAKVVLDCAQSATGFDLDWLGKGADALAFSGHKVFGPSGVGVLVLSKEWMKSLPPFVFGGGMISDVTLEGSTFTEGPAKFEAGTPPITEVIGLGAALEWIESKGRSNIHHHAAGLAGSFRQGLADMADVEIFGPGSGLENVVPFRLKKVHAHDVATLLDASQVCVRAGHHCAWPLIRALGVDALLRASFSTYNDAQDVELALSAIQRISKGLG